MILYGISLPARLPCWVLGLYSPHRINNAAATRWALAASALPFVAPPTPRYVCFHHVHPPALSHLCHTS